MSEFAGNVIPEAETDEKFNAIIAKEFGRAAISEPFGLEMMTPVEVSDTQANTRATTRTTTIGGQSRSDGTD